MTNVDLLTDDDLDTLVDSLEAWENKGFAGEVMGDLMGAMLMDRKNPEQVASFERERLAQRAKAEREKVARKERSIILRAKLLSIRNERRVGRVESAVLREPVGL
jgi:hypothetical protein